MEAAIFVAILISSVVLTLILSLTLQTVWKKKRKYGDNETKQLLSKEMDVPEAPALGTKVATVQPLCADTTQNEDEDLQDIEDSNAYLYFTIKYDYHRSILKVKLIKGENIPTQKSYPSKPYIEIQILPEKVELTHGSEGVEFHIPQEKLFRQTVHFCVCRYDTFSRKTTVGDVFLSMAELKADRADLSREAFMKNLITPNLEISLRQKQTASELWGKLKMAVLEGKLRQLKRRSFVEPLTWDDDMAHSAEIGLLEAAERENKTNDTERRKSVKLHGPLGTLFFSLKYDAKSVTLLVRIMKADDIPDHEGLAPNVLVECALLPQAESEKHFSTNVQENTFTPVFEEVFQYKVYFEELWKKKLHLVVWYVDAYSHLTCLGEVIHSLSQLDIEGFDISKTAMLFSKEITLLRRTKDSPVKDSKEDSSSILLSLTYLPATNRLGVLILKAKDLKTEQDNGGVYVEVAVLHHNMRHRKVTSFKTGTNNPLFNEALLFDLKDVFINEVRLQVTVFQKVTMRSDVTLGRAIFGRRVGGSEESHWHETLNAPKATAQWHKLQPCPTAVKQPVQGVTAMKTRELKSFGFSKTQHQSVQN